MSNLLFIRFYLKNIKKNREIKETLLTVLIIFGVLLGYFVFYYLGYLSVPFISKQNRTTGCFPHEMTNCSKVIYCGKNEEIYNIISCPTMGIIFAAVLIAICCIIAVIFFGVYKFYQRYVSCCKSYKNVYYETKEELRDIQIHRDN